MDEVLLRRLLGAGALLAIALLFSALLPEPGPAGPKEGVVAYDLRTNRRIGAQPPVENPPVLKPAEALAPRVATTVADPRPEAPLPPRPALKVDETLGPGGAWHVQVGSFGKAPYARAAAEKLLGMGLKTSVQTVSMGETQWYRVRVGPYASEGAALDALARVKKGGFPDAQLARPESAPTKRN